MDNVHVPTHQAHQQPKYGRVAALVGQKELCSKTVRDPDKALAEHIMSNLINTIVTCEILAKMRV